VTLTAVSWLSRVVGNLLSLLSGTSGTTRCAPLNRFEWLSTISWQLYCTTAAIVPLGLLCRHAMLSSYLFPQRAAQQLFYNSSQELG
jgi:hypothetical protein